MARVVFADQEKAGDFEEGRTLLACAQALAVRISSICGGDGACGTCRVEVVAGREHLSPATPDEICKEIDEPYRLGCQAKVAGDVVVKVAKIE